MSEVYSFKSVLEQGGNLFGSNICIDAVLIIRGGEDYLVEAVEFPESLHRIYIHSPGLELQLDLTVGGWMGEAYSYLDPVRIAGKLEMGTVGKNRFSISDVTEITLTRDDESTRVLLNKDFCG